MCFRIHSLGGDLDFFSPSMILWAQCRTKSTYWQDVGATDALFTLGNGLLKHFSVAIRSILGGWYEWSGPQGRG
jgi:hypothetical protein